jgi:HK97 family phage prohead protease
MQLHPKIKELKQRALPTNESMISVDYRGELVENKTLKGYLIVWGVRDTYGTKFLKGCCAKSIRERGPESNSKQKIAFCWQHDITDPIGRFTKLTEDNYGLYFEADVDADIPEVPNAARALNQIRNGTINQFSVGFSYIWDKIEYDETDDSLILKEIDLDEGSVVTLGANAETYAIRSQEQYEQVKEILQDETEDFIKTLPRAKQLECRQIIARQISLASVKPDELRRNPLPRKEPVEAGLDINYIISKL